ncbi:MAG: isoprenylcysteine carboxylmethyltransferase family protein [Thaumarchaeota archaeon]|nr:isoprenylcysteine carboxylmethyltransferase family protein [Nitrososphaerota archaeon]
MIPLVFLSPFDAGLYLAVTVSWILSILVERLIIGSAGQRTAQVRSDRGSALLIFFSIFASILIANEFAQYGVALLPAMFFYVGLAMMLAGISTRIWAVSTLRNFFSYTVQIKQGHQVVESGPYRFVRHPAYTGSLLTILGVGFALQSWGAVVVMVVIFGIAFGYRISVEEKALVASLGDAYVLYSKRVKRLVPYAF